MDLYINNKELVTLPQESILGSLVHYISNSNIKDFQPMNANFGILPELNFKHHKSDRKRLYGERALSLMKEVKENYGL